MDRMEQFRKENPGRAAQIQQAANNAREGAEEILGSIEKQFGNRAYCSAICFNRISSNVDALMAIIALLIAKGPPPASMLEPISKSVEKAAEAIMEEGISLVALSLGPDGQVKDGIPKEKVGDYMTLVNAANKRLENATINVLRDIG